MKTPLFAATLLALLSPAPAQETISLTKHIRPAGAAPLPPVASGSTPAVSLIASVWEVSPGDARDGVALGLLEQRHLRDGEDFLQGLAEISTLRDPALVSLLQSGWWELLARRLPALAAEILPHSGRVSDPSLIEIIAASWAQRDASRSHAWVLGLKGDEVRHIAFNTWLVSVMETSPDQALGLLLDEPASFMAARPDALMRVFFESGLGAEHEEALSALLSSPERQNNLLLFLKRWAADDSEVYEAWTASLREPALRELAATAVAPKPLR